MPLGLMGIVFDTHKGEVKRCPLVMGIVFDTHKGEGSWLFYWKAEKLLIDCTKRSLQMQGPPKKRFLYLLANINIRISIFILSPI